MAVAWPATLPTYFNEQGFAFEVGDTTLRSQNQVGPAKVRRVATKSVDRLTGTMNLTPEQYSAFYYFFDTTLNGGVKTFNFNHPITSIAAEMRFEGPPKFSSLGGGNFLVSFSWEIMP